MSSNFIQFGRMKSWLTSSVVTYFSLGQGSSQSSVKLYTHPTSLERLLGRPQGEPRPHTCPVWPMQLPVPKDIHIPSVPPGRARCSPRWEVEGTLSTETRAGLRAFLAKEMHWVGDILELPRLIHKKLRSFDLGTPVGGGERKAVPHKTTILGGKPSCLKKRLQDDMPSGEKGQVEWSCQTHVQKQCWKSGPQAQVSQLMSLSRKKLPSWILPKFWSHKVMGKINDCYKPLSTWNNEL